MDNNKIIIVFLSVLIIVLLATNQYTIINDSHSLSSSFLIINNTSNNITFTTHIHERTNGRTCGIINFISNETDSYSLWIRYGELGGIFLYRIHDLNRILGDFTGNPHPEELLFKRDISSDVIFWNILVSNETKNGFNIDIYENNNKIMTYYSDETYFGSSFSYGTFTNSISNISYMRMDLKDLMFYGCCKT